MTTALKEQPPLSNTEIEGYLLFLRSNPQSRVFAPVAEFLVQSNRLAEAERICCSGLQANPDFASGHLAYARVLFKLLRYREALEQAKQTLRLNRSNADAYVLAAEIYVANNRPQAAQKACVKALEIEPNKIEAERILSQITHATAPRAPQPVLPQPANRGMAITDTSSNQGLRPQRQVPAEKPLKKIIADVGREAEALLDQVQQPFSAESSGSQPKSNILAALAVQSSVSSVDLAQAVIDSYADRSFPALADLSPLRLPPTDRWINMLWLMVIVGLLGALLVLGFLFGGRQNLLPTTGTATVPPTTQPDSPFQHNR